MFDVPGGLWESIGNWAEKRRVLGSRRGAEQNRAVSQHLQSSAKVPLSKVPVTLKGMKWSRKGKEISELPQEDAVLIKVFTPSFIYLL